ncbi:unnamed protein product [Ambrosiozyma monospora]|uniref:Unnamed protein product n=1 Tax=Ambrosiozyma monospora TaxID=43982 RepID=A0ACB5SWA5_AMBMO|nr:unnamed protein product [Ambrosiozyma monospora]
MRNNINTTDEDIIKHESSSFKTISILPNKNDDGTQPPAYQLTYQASSHPKLDTCAGVTICDNIDLIHDFKGFNERTSDLYSVSTTGIGDHPIKICGVGKLKIVAKGANDVSKTVVTKTLYAPNCSGTFICHEQLSIDGLEYRSIKRKPYLSWKKQKMLIYKNAIDKMPSIPLNCFIVAPHKVYGVHQRYGHWIDNTRLGLETST